MNAGISKAQVQLELKSSKCLLKIVAVFKITDFYMR